MWQELLAAAASPGGANSGGAGLGGYVGPGSGGRLGNGGDGDGLLRSGPGGGG